MTDKELKKLSRVQLLELLLEQTRRADRLEKQLLETKAKLKRRDIQVSEAGSLAEAALELNGVFSAAQAAADQYLNNVRSRNEVLDDARQEADEILKTAREQAEAMTEKARQDAQRYWDETVKKFNTYMEKNPALKQQLLHQAGQHRL